MFPFIDASFCFADLKLRTQLFEYRQDKST